MKTTKLILAMVFIAFSTMVFSQNAKNIQNEKVPILSMSVSLEEAIQNPALVRAMRAQLDPSFLYGPHGHVIYTAQVKLPNVIYLIGGTFAEWEKFFYGHIFNDRRDT